MELLRRYDLIPDRVSDAKPIYGKVANVWFYRLTEREVELASQAFREMLNGALGDLVDALDRYPKGLVGVVALSAMYPDGEVEPISIPVEGKDLESAYFGVLHDFELLMMRPEELREAFITSKRVRGDLSLLHERLRRARAGMYKPSVYDMFVSRFLVSYNGRVHEEAIGLMEDLTTRGLAIRIPTFTSKGEYGVEVYRAPQRSHTVGGIRV